jgi:prepilin-type N-terminal cleavage/methylation domain-containing protein
MRPSWNRAHPAAGFTLLELCATLAVFSVLAGVAVMPMHRWIAGERQGSTTAALIALLRETQQRAVTEGRSLCVEFDLSAQTWSVLRGACESPERVPIEGPMRPEPGVRLASAGFTAGGRSGSGVTFFPRGTATPGSVAVGRAGSGRVDTLFVEGLTGRVSRS